MPLRILAPLALVLALTAGCGTIPLRPPLSLSDPCDPVRKVTVAFGAVGFVAALPADLVLLPITYPIAKAAGGGRYSAIGAFFAPSFVAGVATALPASLAAWTLSLPARDVAPSSTRSRIRRLRKAGLLDGEDELGLDGVLVRSLALGGPHADEAAQVLAERPSAVPLLVRALDDPERAGLARYALERLAGRDANVGKLLHERGR